MPGTICTWGMFFLFLILSSIPFFDYQKFFKYIYFEKTFFYKNSFFCKTMDIIAYGALVSIAISIVSYVSIEFYKDEREIVMEICYPIASGYILSYVFYAMTIRKNRIDNDEIVLNSLEAIVRCYFTVVSINKLYKKLYCYSNPLINCKNCEKTNACNFCETCDNILLYIREYTNTRTLLILNFKPEIYFLFDMCLSNIGTSQRMFQKKSIIPCIYENISLAHKILLHQHKDERFNFKDCIEIKKRYEKIFHNLKKAQEEHTKLFSQSDIYL